MKVLLKISGLLKLNHKLNERGFVFLELMIGLPLIVMLLWSMNRLFINSLNECKFMMADFILQQEMESAMARIVETAKFTYNFEKLNDINTFHYYKLDGDFIDIINIDNLNDDNTHDVYKYFENDGKIYRGVKSGISNPITGDSWLFNTTVTAFKCEKMPSNPKLLYVRLEAKSDVSEHKIILITEVFMRGLK